MALMNRVRAIGTGVAGAPYYITFYFAAATGSAQASTDAMRTFLNSARAVWSTDLSVTMDSVVQQIESTNGDATNSISVTPGAAIQGSGTGVALPRQVQIGMRLQTGAYSGGRQIRGHFSLGSLTAGVGAAQGPNTAATAVITLQTAANTLVADPNSDWVVYSRKNGSFAVVASATVSPIWFTLRSRLT